MSVTNSAQLPNFNKSHEQNSKPIENTSAQKQCTVSYTALMIHSTTMLNSNIHLFKWMCFNTSCIIKSKLKNSNLTKTPLWLFKSWHKTLHMSWRRKLLIQHCWRDLMDRESHERVHFHMTDITALRVFLWPERFFNTTTDFGPAAWVMKAADS